MPDRCPWRRSSGSTEFCLRRGTPGILSWSNQRSPPPRSLSGCVNSARSSSNTSKAMLSPAAFHSPAGAAHFQAVRSLTPAAAAARANDDPSCSTRTTNKRRLRGQVLALACSFIRAPPWAGCLAAPASKEARMNNAPGNYIETRPLNSFWLKARIVVVRTFPAAPKASSAFVRVASSAASTIPTRSYWPSVQ